MDYEKEVLELQEKVNGLEYYLSGMIRTNAVLLQKVKELEAVILMSDGRRADQYSRR